MERGIHAASACLFQATSKRHECRAPVQGFHARIVSGKSHLDPLPSSDEGRGNAIASLRRSSAWVSERGRIFPLSFRRGEDQGEGLIQWTFVSLRENR